MKQVSFAAKAAVEIQANHNSFTSEDVSATITSTVAIRKRYTA